MNTKSIFLALCCLTAFSSYAQHVPTLEEVVNGGRKPGKLAFRGEQLFKEGEKSDWGIRHRFVYAR